MIVLGGIYSDRSMTRGAVVATQAVLGKREVDLTEEVGNLIFGQRDSSIPLGAAALQRAVRSAPSAAQTSQSTLIASGVH